MNTRNLLHIVYCLVLAGVFFTGCTASKEPVRLIVNRTEDTVYFSLHPESSDRWWSSRDSIIVECLDCEQGTLPVIERFENENFSSLELEGASTLRFKIFSDIITDTTIALPGAIIDTAKITATPRRKPRITASKPTRKRTTAASNKLTAPKVKAKPETVEVKEDKKVAKKATSIRVIATEGVAVYKDKSKTEVLRIVPKGEVLPYLAKEGDMYSVSVGGTEGFVEAEAVQLSQ